MTDALARLCELISPPSEPVLADGDWAVVERQFGALPTEWREFIRAYGSGQFYDGFDPLFVLNPLDPAGLEQINLGLEVQASEIAFGKRIGDETDPYPGIHPERPGSLPWGCDDQRGWFGWLTDHDSERWTTVCNVETKFRRFGCGLTEFLLGTLARVGPSRWYDSDVYAPREGDTRVFHDVRRVRFYTSLQSDFYTLHRAEYPWQAR